MNEALTSTLMPIPLRAVLSDDPEEILRFAINAYRDGGVGLWRHSSKFVGVPPARLARMWRSPLTAVSAATFPVGVWKLQSLPKRCLQSAEGKDRTVN